MVLALPPLVVLPLLAPMHVPAMLAIMVVIMHVTLALLMPILLLVPLPLLPARVMLVTLALAVVLVEPVPVDIIAQVAPQKFNVQLGLLLLEGVLVLVPLNAHALQDIMAVIMPVHHVLPIPIPQLVPPPLLLVAVIKDIMVLVALVVLHVRLAIFAVEGQQRLDV